MSLIVGLTGGIGSGKTFVAKLFAELNVPVYISDEKAKEIMERPEVVQSVQELFSTNVLKGDKLDRDIIRAEVFGNAELLEKLNQVVHPLVKQDFKNWVALHADADFVLKESAILFEKGLDKECDLVILVTAPEEDRVKRVMKRDNTSEEQVRKIIAVQLKDEQKIVKSDYVIANSDINSVKKEVLEVYRGIKVRKK